MKTARLITILLISITLSLPLFCQTVVIEVIPTGGLDKATAQDIDILLHKLNKGKKGAKAKFAFVLSNIYNLNDDKLIVKSDDPLASKDNYFKSTQNFNFKSKNELYAGLLNYAEEDNYNIFYSKGFNELNDSRIINQSNQEALVKVLRKKSKKKTIKILLDNGFLEPAYSKERLEKFLNSRSSNCDMLKPQFTEIRDRYQLRPEGFYYVIEFDTIGFFDSYELEIYRNSDGVKRILVKNVFSTNGSDASEDYYLTVSGKSRKAKIFLKESYLGLNCVNNIRKENILGKGWDPLCGECQNECLYQTNFNIRIRGLAEGYTEDCLWVDEIKKIEFQCTTK
jgi:hypothetical protein